MLEYLSSVFCCKREEAKYEQISSKDDLVAVDARKVNTAVNVVKLFLPDCLNVDDVLESRDELKKLAQARNISRILAKSASAIQIARGLRCPKGAESVLRQTIADNGVVFRSMYSVLAYLYLSPGADTDGMLNQVVAHTADRTMMLGDISVLSHAMKVEGVDKPHSSQDLIEMGLAATQSGEDSIHEPMQLVRVMEEQPAPDVLEMDLATIEPSKPVPARKQQQQHHKLDDGKINHQTSRQRGTLVPAS